ncbi:MAG: HAD-IIIA family hydrolase [bacterium]|nr:HAD-IIIA family hydrolase [bacterium]
MLFLEQNIKGICERHGLDYADFLDELDVDHPKDLSIYDLEAIAEEYEIDLSALLFKHTFRTSELANRLKNIKLLILDVDGVMTDGGLYFTDEGDHIKKFNAKDGMAIAQLTKRGFQVGIISSGFSGTAVKRRADLLGIQHCSVNKEPKLTRLRNICASLSIDLDQVAMIGDDINDLEVFEVCGFSVCPSDAVPVVKKRADLILSSEGGKGAIREFVDEYLLEERLK